MPSMRKCSDFLRVPVCVSIWDPFGPSPSTSSGLGMTGIPISAAASARAPRPRTILSEPLASGVFIVRVRATTRIGLGWRARLHRPRHSPGKTTAKARQYGAHPHPTDCHQLTICRRVRYRRLLSPMRRHAAGRLQPARSGCLRHSSPSPVLARPSSAQRRLRRRGPTRAAPDSRFGARCGNSLPRARPVEWPSSRHGAACYCWALFWFHGR
jgi:hypothetical protein